MCKSELFVGPNIEPIPSNGSLGIKESFLTLTIHFQEELTENFLLPGSKKTMALSAAYSFSSI